MDLEVFRPEGGRIILINDFGDPVRSFGRAAHCAGRIVEEVQMRNRFSSQVVPAFCPPG